MIWSRTGGQDAVVRCRFQDRPLIGHGQYFDIDVAGISKTEKSLVLGDCYWRETPMGPEAISDLVQNVSAIVPKDDATWQVYITLFSSSGWTDKAQAEARDIVLAASSRSRRRWRSMGVRLVDLENVDENLQQWSH